MTAMRASLLLALALALPMFAIVAAVASPRHSGAGPSHGRVATSHHHSGHHHGSG